VSTKLTVTPSVEVKALAHKTFSDRLVYPATVTATATTEVSSEVEGVVTEVRARLGQRVNQGSPLVKIENRDPVYKFEPFFVLAPSAGSVTAVAVAPGNRVVRSKGLVTLTDLSRLIIKAEVTVDDLAKLRRGLPGVFRTTAGTPIKVKVAALSPVIDPATGTATCEFEVTGNDTRGILPGVLGKVVVEINPRRSLAVAEESIYYRGSSPYVMALTDERRVKFADVKILARQGDLVEIETSLKEGVPIVVRSSGFVGEGDQVELQNSQGPNQ
jgi:multidrug efflux pump subunit AcrA (membrane-fusion protein)